ncbi:MAG: KH domain-containing protein [Erysipelothrix sp.]|nr:KH domain-containing protein [Erysipelothrix sp.]
MNKLEKTLYDLILPLVNDKESLRVEETKNNKKIVNLNVVSAKEDVSRLIGKRGTMATAIRQTMAIAGRLENKRVMINFES